MIGALQNTISQGIKLDSVNLTANGDYESTYKDSKGNFTRPFILDLPTAGTMNVQFQDGTIGTYSFREGSSPVVKLVRVFSTGSTVKIFQVIY